MSKEVCEYRVSLRGRPVGSYRLTSLAKDNTVLLEAQLDLQGSLGRKSVYQSSSIQQESWASLEFVETYRSGTETRTFEVNFDQDEGVVKARRGNRDQASIPYIQAYRDPLSIFYELRQTDSTRLHLPLIGKDIVLEHVSDVTLTTSFGPKQALVYSCQPGGNYVYVEDSSSRTILKLSQRLDGQMLEASLVKVSYETESRKLERRDRKRRSSGMAVRQPRAQQFSRQQSGQRGRQQQSSQQQSGQRDSQQPERESHPQHDSSRRNSNPRGRRRSQRRRANQATKRSGHSSNRQNQRQAGSAGAQPKGSSDQQPTNQQESNPRQQGKRSHTKKRNKSAQHPNRSRKNNAKSQADSE